ncbi:MAG: hypothetical protein GKS07_01985 [Nitrosopumilus sp.]|nr:MAG: hypothetical protein GKS07_01985 [Nitrosopumilus sp.]
MVETEYLIKVPQDKFRGGNQENMYYLTTKGMIAALSSGLHLDEIYLYKKYIHFLENILDDERLFNIVNDFLKNRIYLFLAWHAFNGIQLQKQIATQSYFRTFFRSTKLLTEYIPYDETCANEDFHVFLKNNFVSSGIIHCLLEISTDNILIHANVTEQRSDKIYNKLYRNRAFLEFWPMLIEEMQKIDYDSQILFDHLESIGGGNIVIDSGKESDKIKTELDKGINVKVSSDAVYQFLEYNSPNTIKNGDTSLQDLATHNL